MEGWTKRDREERERPQHACDATLRGGEEFAASEEEEHGHTTTLVIVVDDVERAKTIEGVVTGPALLDGAQRPEPVVAARVLGLTSAEIDTRKQRQRDRNQNESSPAVAHGTIHAHQPSLGSWRRTWHKGSRSQRV
jgi:hypothetical protein